MLYVWGLLYRCPDIAIVVRWCSMCGSTDQWYKSTEYRYPYILYNCIYIYTYIHTYNHIHTILYRTIPYCCTKCSFTITLHCVTLYMYIHIHTHSFPQVPYFIRTQNIHNNITFGIQIAIYSWFMYPLNIVISHSKLLVYQRVSTEKCSGNVWLFGDHRPGRCRIVGSVSRSPCGSLMRRSLMRQAMNITFSAVKTIPATSNQWCETPHCPFGLANLVS